MVHDCGCMIDGGTWALKCPVHAAAGRLFMLVKRAVKLFEKVPVVRHSGVLVSMREAVEAIEG